MKPLCDFLINKYVKCKHDKYNENKFDFKECQKYFVMVKACTYYLE